VDRDRRKLLHSSVEVPDRTVYREFPGETIALNADTGHYFGLNATAARMLAALEEAGTVAGALALLAERLGLPAKEIEHDLLELCSVFQERGLIVLGPADGG
jgi:Coenzyme PQQ synthesis protein D (PqqD)